jgi:hypothetical protein
MSNLNKRLKVYSFSSEFIKQMVVVGNETFASRVIKGIPKDACVVNSYCDSSGAFGLTVASQEFEEVKEGKGIPLGEIILERTT